MGEPHQKFKDEQKKQEFISATQEFVHKTSANVYVEQPVNGSCTKFCSPIGIICSNFNVVKMDYRVNSLYYMNEDVFTKIHQIKLFQRRKYFYPNVASMALDIEAIEAIEGDIKHDMEIYGVPYDGPPPTEIVK